MKHLRDSFVAPGVARCEVPWDKTPRAPFWGCRRRPGRGTLSCGSFPPSSGRESSTQKPMAYPQRSPPARVGLAFTHPPSPNPKLGAAVDKTGRGIGNRRELFPPMHKTKPQERGREALLQRAGGAHGTGTTTWSPLGLGVPQLKPQTPELCGHEQATEAKPCGLLPPARPGCACHAVKTEFILIQTSAIQSTKARFFFRTATNYPPLFWQPFAQPTESAVCAEAEPAGGAESPEGLPGCRRVLRGEQGAGGTRGGPGLQGGIPSTGPTTITATRAMSHRDINASPVGHLSAPTMPPEPEEAQSRAGDAPAAHQPQHPSLALLGPAAPHEPCSCSQQKPRCQEGMSWMPHP